MDRNSTSLPPYQLPNISPRFGSLGTTQSEISQINDTRTLRHYDDGDSGDYAQRGSAFNRSGQRGSFSGLRNNNESGQSSYNYRDNHDNYYKKRGFYKGQGYQDYGRDRSNNYNSYAPSGQRSYHDWSKQNFNWNNKTNNSQNWGKFRLNQPKNQNDLDKYTSDYDYEKANAELAAELKKIDISAVSLDFKLLLLQKAPSVNLVDDSADQSNGESGSVDGAGCYDQTRSFFDTLSSEIIDRANG